MKIIKTVKANIFFFFEIKTIKQSAFCFVCFENEQTKKATLDSSKCKNFFKKKVKRMMRCNARLYFMLTILILL